MNSSLSPQVAAGLEQLRDIRLPQAISWWPLAPGWWLLVGLILVSLAGLWWWRHYRRRQLRQRALHELTEIRRNQSLYDNPAALSEQLSRLLKRALLLQPEARNAISASGEQWRTYLMSDTQHGLDAQTSEFLVNGPYQTASSTISLEPDQVLDAVERWIGRNL